MAAPAAVAVSAATWAAVGAAGLAAAVVGAAAAGAALWLHAARRDAALATAEDNHAKRKKLRLEWGLGVRSTDIGQIVLPQIPER